MITIEQIKENIKCPQFGDLEYGKWGALRFEQRKAYKYLIDIVEDLEQENKQLKEEKRKVIECIHKMQQNFKQEEHTGSAYDDDLFYEDLLEILGDKE